MRASELRHRIIIQASTKISDGMGSFTTSWSDVATIWAGIWPLRPKEVIENMRAEGKLTHRIRIRYRKNLTSANRLKFGNRYFNIKGPPINPNERNIYLDIMAEETA